MALPDSEQVRGAAPRAEPTAGWLSTPQAVKPLTALHSGFSHPGGHQPSSFCKPHGLCQAGSPSRPLCPCHAWSPFISPPIL